VIDSAGWRLPVIFNHDSDVWLPFVVVVVDLNVSDVNVGPQLPFSRLSRQAQLPLASAVQQDSRPNQKQGEHGNRASEYHQPPVGRRLLLAIFGVLDAFFCGLRYLDEERRALAAVWLAIAILCGVAGMGLWWATGFRETWGWPV